MSPIKHTSGPLRLGWSTALAAALLLWGAVGAQALQPVPGANRTGPITAALYQTPGPTLLTPPDQAPRQSTRPELAWQAVAGASAYAVQVSADPSFLTPVVNVRVAALQQPRAAYLVYPPLAPGTRYVWHVAALGPDGPSSAWSATRAFETARLSGPALIAPAAQALDISWQPRLVWQYQVGATDYRVQLTDEPRFASPLLDVTSPTTSLRLERPLEPGQTYYWRVAAQDGEGRASDWSAAGQFQVAAPPVPSPAQTATPPPAARPETPASPLPRLLLAALITLVLVAGLGGLTRLWWRHSHGRPVSPRHPTQRPKPAARQAEPPSAATIESAAPGPLMETPPPFQGELPESGEEPPSNLPATSTAQDTENVAPLATATDPAPPWRSRPPEMLGAAALAVGARLADSYELRAPLGQSQPATAYRAWDYGRNADVVLRVVPAEADAARIFLDRAGPTLVQLRHPHLLRCRALEQLGERRILVEDYAAGGSLRDRIQALPAEARRLPPATAIQIALQVGQALAYLHRAGLVHGDVRPATILFRTPQHWQALLAPPDGRGAQPVASPYRAPEQAPGAAALAVDQRADLYALGVTLQELLIGHLAPSGSGLQHAGLALPLALIPMLHKTLAASPVERWPTAEAMILALESLD